MEIRAREIKQDILSLQGQLEVLSLEAERERYESLRCILDVAIMECDRLHQMIERDAAE